MVLLLDPWDIIQDILSETENFDKNNNALISERLVVDAMLDIVEELYTVPDEALTNIKEVIIINPYGELFEYDEKVHIKVIKKVKQKTNSQKYIRQLFFDAKPKTLKNDQERVEFVHSLRFEYSRKQFIFFDTLLTNFVVSSLVEGTGIDSSKIMGYRYFESESSGEWVIIEDISKYLIIGYILLLRFFDVSSSIKSGKSHLLNVLAQGNINTFFSALENDESKKHICYFRKSDHAELDILIELLNKKFGNFKIYICSSKGYELPSKAEQLLILEFGSLNDFQQRDLLVELVEGPYKNSKVIIITDKQPKTIGLAQFNFWPGLSKNLVQPFLEGFDQLITKFNELINTEIEESKYIVAKIADDEKQQKRLLRKLDDCFIGDEFYNQDKVDFIYDAPAGLDRDQNKLLKPFKEIVRNHFTLLQKTKFYISRDKKYWIIEIDDEAPFRVSLKSRAIRYIIYLYKHYADGNTIEFSNLIDVASKWEQKDKIFETKASNKYLDISRSLSNLYDKNEQLRPLQKCIELSSIADQGCYFRKNFEIEIQLDDFFIPEAI